MKDVPSIINIIFTLPISIYLITYVIIISIIHGNYSGNSAYVYALIFNYSIISILGIIHYVLHKIIKKNEPYEETYRGQWVYLIYLSPIYSISVLYILKKLFNQGG